MSIPTSSDRSLKKRKKRRKSSRPYFLWKGNQEIPGSPFPLTWNKQNMYTGSISSDPKLEKRFSSYWAEQWTVSTNFMDTRHRHWFHLCTAITSPSAHINKYILSKMSEIVNANN
jgi:hypothetical protein